MPQHRYEAVAWDSTDKTEVIKPANGKGDAIQAAARLIADHTDKPGTLIFIRQYYASSEPGRFRVLHKYTRRITATPEHAGYIVIAATGCASLKVPVSSCAEASAVWQNYRDEHGLAASDMGALCGHVYTTAGDLVAKVSYNGRVWDTQGKTNPGGRHPMMNAQQAEEFVRLVADMTTGEERAAAFSQLKAGEPFNPSEAFGTNLPGIVDDLIATARQIARPPAPPAEPTAQQLELMAVEWSAWRNIARLWKTHRPSMEAPENNQLVLAIRMWGEELVALRLTQTPKLRADARVMNATERPK